MRFCTAINCMDGRAQVPVIRYLQKRFDAEYVDIVSEPGPNRILAAGQDTVTIASIERRVQLSVQRHQSVGVAVIGHHDCAGNPSPAVQQNLDTAAAVLRIRTAFRHIPVIGLWLNESWEVEELQDEAVNKPDAGDS
ncbi:MAG: carbonic anhydrase [Planctomycetota bacterium]